MEICVVFLLKIETLKNKMFSKLGLETLNRFKIAYKWVNYFIEIKHDT